MSKQDTIISLLKEINENVDNLEQISIVKDIIATENDKEYLPAYYGVDAFGKVKTELRNLVKVSYFTVSNDCINEEGRWEGEKIIDTSTVTSFNYLFHKNTKIKRLDASSWDTSNVVGTYYCFHSCALLEWLNITHWDCSNFKSVSIYFFYGCRSLNTLIGGATIEDVLTNNITVMNGLKDALSVINTKLDRASLRALINGIADLTGQTAQTLEIGEALIAKLTEEDIAIATAKNWTIA